VDVDILYGEQTRLALANFPLRGRRLFEVPDFLGAYAHVKAAAARANMELGVLDRPRGDAIVQAALEVAAGQHADQFPLPLVQGGGGTSTNMNVNEVLAARATQLVRAVTVDAHDHVNRSQSTNDTYPTAMALAVRRITQSTLAAMATLAESFDHAGARWGGMTRLGRTCLQDAVPLTVGQTHRAHAHSVRRARSALADAVDALTAVPLGATAIGTGIGSPPGYAAAAIRQLAAVSGQPVTAAENYFDALANLDGYSAVGNACVRAALVIGKIAGDVRLLSSGPAGGLGEVTLPALQPGSSIMPGKVNPVIPEAVMQLGCRIRGAAATVDLAVAGGELELNIMEPVILDALVGALQDLADAASSFATKCVDGLVWNEGPVAAHLAGSRAPLVELSERVGHRRALDGSAS
jgi:aspartate ammonia-lyase